MNSFTFMLYSVKMAKINFNYVEGEAVVYLSIYCVNFLCAEEPNLLPTKSEVRVELDKAAILIR